MRSNIPGLLFLCAPLIAACTNSHPTEADAGAGSDAEAASDASQLADEFRLK